MTTYIVTTHQNGAWGATRSTEPELKEDFPDGLVSIIPEYEEQLGSVWIQNRLDPDSGGTLSITVHTEEPAGWKAVGGSDVEATNGVVAYRPIRSGNENYGTFMRMVIVD